MEVAAGGHQYGDSVRTLVDDPDILSVNDEAEDTCLVVLDREGIFHHHIAVLDPNSLRRGQVQTVPHMFVGRSAVGKGEVGDSHCALVVRLGNSDDNRFGFRVHGSLEILIQSERDDLTVAGKAEVVCGFVACCESEEKGRQHQNRIKMCFHITILLCFVCNGRWKRRSARREWADTRSCRR